jgi:hypothetical protein
LSFWNNKSALPEYILDYLEHWLVIAHHWLIRLQEHGFFPIEVAFVYRFQPHHLGSNQHYFELWVWPRLVEFFA